MEGFNSEGNNLKLTNWEDDRTKKSSRAFLCSELQSRWDWQTDLNGFNGFERILSSS